MTRKDAKLLGSLESLTSGSHQKTISVSITIAYLLIQPIFLFAEGIGLSLLFYPLENPQAYANMLPGILVIMGYFGLFGAVFSLSALLNLNNTMAFSLYQRRPFWGICRALGATKKDVRRIYFYALFYAVKDGSKPLLILGTIEAAFEALVWNWAVLKITDQNPIRWSLRISYLGIPAAFLTLLLFLLLWFLVSSLFLTFDITHKKELDLLNGGHE
jgi:hypothetical protein